MHCPWKCIVLTLTVEKEAQSYCLVEIYIYIYIYIYISAESVVKLQKSRFFKGYIKIALVLANKTEFSFRKILGLAV